MMPLTLHLGIAAMLIVMTTAQCKQSNTCVHCALHTPERVDMEEVHIFEVRSVKL